MFSFWPKLFLLDYHILNNLIKSENEVGKYSYWNMECPRRTRPISWNKNKTQTVDWFLQFWNQKKVFLLYCCRCNKKVDVLGLRKEPWIHQWQPVVANNEKNDVYSPFRYSILAAWIIIFQLDCRTEKRLLVIFRKWLHKKY